MLNNATGFQKIYIAAGYTDLRHGIDVLASIVKFNFQMAPHKRRGAGDHAGTIPGIDAGAGDCLQTSDLGSAPTGSSIRHCAKRRK